MQPSQPEERPDLSETAALPVPPEQKPVSPAEESTLAPEEVPRPPLPLTEDGTHLQTGPMPAFGEPARPLPQVPGYDLLQEIGRGGMGVVYRAMDLRLKRPVALKMILAGDHSAVEMRSRFRTEAEAVAQLQHPNIVQIYEIGEHNGLPYFALEYVNGGSLDDVLEGKPLAPHAAAELLLGMARAMQLAHQRGIVHRDLKPGNILLASSDHGASSRELKARSKEQLSSNTGGGRSKSRTPFTLVPKITDFGLAKRLDGGDKHTRTGSILGTPSYMAPEQAEGRNRDVGPATDIWALGAIFYELLTGRPPFIGATQVDTLIQITHDDPVPPLRLQPRLPRDLDTIALKCLQRDPARRYGSAGELAEDLERFLKGVPIRARPIGPLERTGKWIRRQPALAALIAVSVLAVLSGLVVLHQQREEFRYQVVRLSTARGMALTAVDQKQFLDALPWLGTALSQEDRPNQRIRLGMTLERCPWPRQIWFHDGLVTQAAFSKGDQWLLTVSSDGKCQVWDPPDGKLDQSALLPKPVFALEPPHAISFAAFSPDDSPILLVCDRGRVSLWDFLQKKEQVSLPLKEDQELVCRALFSPDGKHVATVSPEGSIKIWDREGRLQRKLPIIEEVGDVQFSPNSRRLLTARRSGKARIWDWAQDSKPLELEETGLVANVVAWSPQGDRVAMGSRKGEVQVWDAKTGTKWPLKKMEHNGTVLSLTFHRPGEPAKTETPLLVSTSDDNTARVWDAGTGLPMTSRLKHGSSVLQASLSADNRRLVTGSDDNMAQVWDVATGDRIGSPLVHNGTVTSVSFNARGEVLTSSHDGTARLWALAPGDPGDFLMEHKDSVRRINCTRDGARLLTASDDGTAQVWDSRTGRHLLTLEQGNNRKVIQAQFSPVQPWIATASSDGRVRFWSADDGEPLRQTIDHPGGINGMILSPDGALVVTAGKDGTARLWNSQDGKPAGVLRGHKRQVFSARFDPQGQRVVTASADSTARVWDTRGATEQACLSHREAVRFADWSLDGKMVVTASNDRTAQVWDLTTSPAAPQAVLVHNGPVITACFNPDGQWVVTGSEDNTARVWDAHTGKPRTRPLEHQGTVHQVRFSPDGRWVATASAGALALVWDLDLQLPLTPPLEHAVDVVDVIFLPNGESVATASLDRTARLWPLHRDSRRVEDLVQISQALAGATVDVESGFNRLQRDRFKDLWLKVRKRYPGNLLRDQQ